MAKVRTRRGTDGRVFYWMFYCPACQQRHVIDDKWTFNGDMERPTISPSIKVTMGPEPGPDGLAAPGAPDRVCHSFVTDGRIAFCADSTHALAGQTVDLPEIEKWATDQD